jgi:fructose-1,6-bisphosphatase/inositol monophosphatase family enzyme
MTPDAVLDLFDATARAVRDAVNAIAPARRRDRTDRDGQYALDLVADEAACAVLARAPVRIVSEESGLHEREGAELTVVLDPVDGSTNCARGIAYWCTSLCALDAEGAFVSLVANHATGDRTVAVRGKGSTRNGVALRAAATTRVADAVIDLSGFPEPLPRGKQTRVLGSIALVLCEIAAGGLDAHVDAAAFTAPWDYLGGMLACLEAGATVLDVHGDPLVTDDVDARRQIIAAATPELAHALLAPEPRARIAPEARA